MPPFTFPIGPDGLNVPVVLGLTGPQTAALLAAGQSVPRPAVVRGVLDSGSDVTCVAPALPQRLGLASAGQTSTTTAGGSVTVNLFVASLSIPGPAGGGMLTWDQLVVMELAQALPTLDVLVGLDVVLQCRLFVDGPGGYFTLDY